MDFVEGESLAYRIEREGPLSEAQVLGWAGQLLDALAYCHSQGVIHRDIKPQNVIIRPDGRAVLVDFGLVKLWDPHDPRTRTAMRGMGTPEYAPPEQYDAHTGHTDARSDLYGLGATLYHALTGQAPPTATLRMADPEQFVPLQAIVPQVSGRTEAAVIKALELNRAQRWQSAAEMAQALELPVWAGKPAVEPAPPAVAGGGGTRAIAPEQALAPPVTERRRVSGGALGGMVALGMLGVVVALAAVFGWFNIGGRVAATPAATRTPTSAPSLLSISPENASRVTQLARWGKGTVTQVAYSPDGRLLAVASSLGVYLYDAETLEEVRFIECGARVYSVAFSPDGATLASGSGDNTVRLWGVADGRLLRTLEGHTYGVESVAFSPDGATLASGSDDTTVRLWGVADGRLLRTLEGHTGGVESVAFSPDGATLASGSRDGTVRLWRVADGRLLRTLEGHTEAVWSVAFSPDGATLASGSGDGTVRLWGVADGRLLRTLEGHTEAVRSVAFSPDGATLASGSWRDNTVRLWRVADGRLLRTLEGHTNGVYSVAFSPDGATLASGSGDGTVRLWGVGR